MPFSDEALTSATSRPPKPDPSPEASPPPEKPAAPVIGILAYGSLITDPGDELVKATAYQKKVETPFPVEFARISENRGDAPTLVRVCSGGSKVAAVLFILKEGITEAKAKSILWRRETRTTEESGKNYTEPDPVRRNSLLARTRTNFEGVDVVIYTDFPECGKLPSPTATQLAEFAVASAGKSGIEPGRDGISYLIDAQTEGIVTPLMPDYEQEILRLTETNSLKDALAKVTGAVPEDKQ